MELFTNAGNATPVSSVRAAGYPNPSWVVTMARMHIAEAPVRVEL
jgi:hypothetical protein